MDASIARLADAELENMLWAGDRLAAAPLGAHTQPLFACEGAWPRGHAVTETLMACACELWRRRLERQLMSRTVLDSPALVREYLQHHFAGIEHEVFVAFWLDVRHRLIACEDLFRGSLTFTAVHPREVAKIALQRNAAAVIFAHNHPSGVAEPSRADELMTHQLKATLNLIDVRLIDHIVVGGAQTCSLAERGLL
jgi:DNA repair protein RadC